MKRRERLIRFAPLSRCITSFLTGLYCEKGFYYCFFKTCCSSIFKKSLFYYCSYLIITEHSINSKRIIVQTLGATHTLFIEKVGIHYFVKSVGNRRAARAKSQLMEFLTH